MFDYETAENIVGHQTHEAFFVTAVSNSCLNPIIYGNYMSKYCKKFHNGRSRYRDSSISGSPAPASSVWNDQSQLRAGRTEICTNADQQFVLSSQSETGKTSSVTV